MEISLDLCEVCHAVPAVGTFDLDDVETPLCVLCCVYRNADNSVVIPNGPQ